MRLLFELNGMDYEKCTKIRVRNSARGIIINDHKIAMVHSLKYDYYKFPGGGIEEGESPSEALIRETREETGLIVRPETIREYGYVHRIQKSVEDASECFIQDNYYYLCEAEKDKVLQRLDKYEVFEEFTLEYIEPQIAIIKNRKKVQSPFDHMMMEREARILELLMDEAIIKE